MGIHYVSIVYVYKVTNIDGYWFIGIGVWIVEVIRNLGLYEG